MEIIIRQALPVDARAVAQVHVESWRETYVGIIDDVYLANLSVDQREEMWHHWFSEQPADSISLVAETDEGQIIGFVDGGKARQENAFRAELYALYVLEAYQKKGLGRRLFDEFKTGMAGLGYKSFYTWVLEGNPTMDFYLHLGGKKLSKQLIELGGKFYTEVMIGYA